MAISGKAEVEGTPLVGVGLLVLGVSLASIGDTIAKYLGNEISLAQIVWARYAFAMVPLAPFLLTHMGPRDIWRHFTPLELLRGLALAAITVFYFGAIQFMPLADALGLLFLYPLLATGLATIFLGERVPASTVVLSLVSFAGALLVIRPGFGEVNIGALLAVLAALAVATNLVINRKLAGTTPVFAGIVLATVQGLVLSSAVVPFYWIDPSWEQWALLAALGLISAAVTWLLYSAFLYGPASVIAPFGYSEIIAATLLGFFVFGDFPDRPSLVGIAVICAAGVALATRNQR